MLIDDPIHVFTRQIAHLPLPFPAAKGAVLK